MLFVLLAVLSLAGETWQSPPDPIDTILDAKSPPGISISPDRAWMLELERPSMPPLARLAQPRVKLAGYELDPKRRSAADLYPVTGLTIRPLGKGAGTPISGLPDDVEIVNLDWSFDSQHITFSNVTDDGLELWMIDAEQASAWRVTGPILNATWGAPCDWLAPGEGLVCKVRPANEAPLPERSVVPAGPRIEENLGEERPGRTWQNLLQDQHDEALFAALLTSEVQHFGMGGKGTAVLEADLIASVTPSPDGKHLLVTTLEQPFSRTVPASRFARRIEVVDLGGTVEHTVARLPVADAIPISFGSVRTGPRGVTWRSDAPATLAWVEALDGGDAGQPADKRDVVRVLEAPFTGTPRDIWRTELRYGGIDWGDGETAIASEWWYDDRRSRVWHIQPDGDGPPRELFDLNYQDAYADPGDPVSRMGPYGWYVLHRTSAGEILLQGRGASPEGVYPFLDAMDLDTLVTRRLWQSADPYYETLSRVLDDDGKRLITRRQSQREPPNYGIRTGKKWSPLTRFQDWAPQLAGLQKQIVTTTRGDGVELSATLYTPPGYKARRDGPLPTVFWAYPREHKSKKTASQITSSENTFSRPGRASVLFLLTQGYAVLSGPTMPIVGEGDAEPNDTYVEQLVASARAHVDNVVDMGVADRERLAIGGHSYGAFTTANLLAHSDLFRAGIARSGAYNRTLTPFGFQGEQRTYWEAMPVYQRMSPFMAAPSIDEPLLMLHGADDSNSGTYPIQSERLYSAIKGHGGTVRWVELPYEDHGYRSREGVGHALWEMVTWLDAHVKSAGPRGE